MPDGPGVKVDEAHCALLAGLVRAHKPENILEFGFGGGGSLQAISDAASDNGKCVEYILVDNWKDFDGIAPPDASKWADILTEIIVMDEGEFVAASIANGDNGFDFIMSDADHANTQKYFAEVYDRLLNPGGILCYHDVCNYPNIWEIVEECRRRGLSHVVFNKNSQPWEACFRGLLVIFKNAE